MSILSLPLVPAVQSSRFGLVSPGSTFVSPLTGQTQTLERPGARWQASYTLPPLKRANAAVWQSFLLQLRGSAGRFYGYDPDALSPRGVALQSSTDTRNEIRNGDAVGAVNGLIGSGGLAPTNWIFGAANGLTRQIVSSGSSNGVSYVDIRFSGVPTANFASLSFDGSTQVVVNEGEVWSGSFSYQLVAGSNANISALNLRFEQFNASGGTALQSYYHAQTLADATLRRATGTRTLSDTTPDSTRLRLSLHLSLTIGAVVDVTLRLGNVQLEKQAAPTLYIPTRTEARSRSSGARVEGNGQNGTQLATWNWQPDTVALLRAGDYVAFDTAAGRALHMVVSDASSDATGRAVLALEPPLRTAPPDNAALILTRAAAVMGLIEGSVQWEADAQGTYRLSFAAEERF